MKEENKMNKRITEKDLQCVVDRINRITNNPLATYKRTNGKLEAQKGNYHIDHGFKGYSLSRVSNIGGGTSDILGNGHKSKQELFYLMQAFIAGLQEAK